MLSAVGHRTDEALPVPSRIGNLEEAGRKEFPERGTS